MDRGFSAFGCFPLDVFEWQMKAVAHGHDRMRTLP